MRGLFFKRDQKGQSLVEFALTLPVLLLLVMGIVQFGIVFNAYITVTSAAREGARLAVVGADDEQVRLRVKEAAAALLLNNLEEGDIDITPPYDPDNYNPTDPGARKVGEELKVRVNGTVPVIVPGLNVFTGNAYSFSSQSIMRFENLPD